MCPLAASSNSGSARLTEALMLTGVGTVDTAVMSQRIVAVDIFGVPKKRGCYSSCWSGTSVEKIPVPQKVDHVRVPIRSFFSILDRRRRLGRDGYWLGVG